MGLSRTISEINGNFSPESQNFPTPVYFAPMLKGLPLELGIGGLGQKTIMMWLSGRERSLTIPSAIWVQSPTWQTDWRTDRHWPTAKTTLMH